MFLCLHCPGPPGPALPCCAHGDGNSGHLPPSPCSRALRRKLPFLISSCGLRLRRLQRPALTCARIPCSAHLCSSTGTGSLCLVWSALTTGGRELGLRELGLPALEGGGLRLGGAAGSAPSSPSRPPSSLCSALLRPREGLSICSPQWAGGWGRPQTQDHLQRQIWRLIPNHLGLGNTELAHVPAA